MVVSLVGGGSSNGTSTSTEITQGKRSGRYHAMHVKVEWCLSDSYSAEGKNKQMMDDETRPPSHLSKDYTKRQKCE